MLPQHSPEYPVPALPVATILENLNIFLDFLQEAPVFLSNTGLLSTRDAARLNTLLTITTETRLSRPVLKSYPYVLGMYWLLRASGLTRVQYINNKPSLSPDTEAVTIWQKLNSAEQYAALLEILLLWCDPSLAGERGKPQNTALFIGMWWNVLKYNKHNLSVKTPKEAEQYAYYTKHTLALLHLFGIMEVTAAPPSDGKGWQFERITTTVFGQKVFGNLLDYIGTHSFELHTQQDEHILSPVINLLHPFFSRHWPDDVKTSLSLARPALGENRILTLGVRFEGAGRTFAVPSETPIEDLVTTILSSVKFAYDHLWYIEGCNAHNLMYQIVHPALEDGIPAYGEQGVLHLSDLPLRTGDQWLMVFDMGDDWHFHLSWNDIADADAKSPATMKLLAKEGIPPPKQ